MSGHTHFKVPDVHRLGSVLTCPLSGIEEALSSGVPSPCGLCATPCELAFEPLMRNLDRREDQMLEGRDLTFQCVQLSTEHQDPLPWPALPVLVWSAPPAPRCPASVPC